MSVSVKLRLQEAQGIRSNLAVIAKRPVRRLKAVPGSLTCVVTGNRKGHLLDGLLFPTTSVAPKLCSTAVRVRAAAKLTYLPIMASLSHANLDSDDEQDEDYDPSKDPTGEKETVAENGKASKRR